MRVDGGCHCGAISYEAELDPDRVVICHCTDCQILSGSAFRTMVPVAGAEFHLLRGEPRVYVKVGASGRPREQAFCTECGTPIYAADPGDGPKDFFLRVGTLRQAGELTPRKQIWRQSALGWLGEIGGMPGVERQ